MNVDCALVFHVARRLAEARFESAVAVTETHRAFVLHVARRLAEARFESAVAITESHALQVFHVARRFADAGFEGAVDKRDRARCVLRLCVGFLK